MFLAGTHAHSQLGQVVVSQEMFDAVFVSKILVLKLDRV
jgi:hypothetical protein